MTYLDRLPPDIIRELIKLLNKDDYLQFVQIPDIIKKYPCDYTKQIEELWSPREGITYHDIYNISVTGDFCKRKYIITRLYYGNPFEAPIQIFRYENYKVVTLKRVTMENDGTKIIATYN